MSEQDLSYKALMAASGATMAASAGAIAAYQGHIPEGLEYANQAKDLVEPVFYDPEMTAEGASNLKDYAVGNVDTLMHGLAGAGISGAANKLLSPGNRTKALAAGLAGGALGYSMLKEGMYEGAFETIDLSIDSIQNAANPGQHVVDELSTLDYNADQQRDLQADTAGVMTERALHSDSNTLEREDELPELEPGQNSTGLGDLLEEQGDPWSPDASLDAGNSKQSMAS